MDSPRRIRACYPRTRAKITIAVGFDFDHTLGIDNKLERVAFLRLLELLLSQGGKTQGTLEEETRHIDELLALQRSGAFSIDDAVAQFVRPRAPQADVPWCIATYKQIAVESVADFVIPMPGAQTMLQALSARDIPVAMLTNGWGALQDRKAERIGFTGPVLVSERIGAQKPKAEAFAALCQTFNLPPKQIWYVGDNPEVDVAGAIAAGMRGVWFDAEGASYASTLPKPSEVIHSLEYLPQVLPGARATV